MSIEIRQQKRQSCPIVVCDHCGQPITEATNGNYEWKMGGSGPVYFTHKDCCREFEEAHGGTLAWNCCGLGVFSIYLDANLRVNREKEMERAAMLAQIGR